MARRLPITQTAAAPTGTRTQTPIDARRQAKGIIATNLTEADTAEARARGEAISQAEAVAYARTAITQALETADPQTPDSPRPDTGEEAELTDRQLEVAELVAKGLSNKAIAKKLDVSPYTVETHVRNILERLDATNRVQIVAWVMSNDPA